jgi:hypothetical protein
MEGVEAGSHVSGAVVEPGDNVPVRELGVAGRCPAAAPRRGPASRRPPVPGCAPSGAR